MLDHNHELGPVPREIPAEHRPEAELRGELIASEGARAEALGDEIRRLARERAGLLSSPSADPQALAELDGRMANELERHRETLSANPELLESLRREARIIEDQERLSFLKRAVIEHARGAGEAQGRVLHGAALASADLALERHLESQSDLLSRYPELDQAIETLRDRAEREGIERRMEADRKAMEIYRALVGVLKDCNAVCDVLGGMDASERKLLSDAYHERYGKDLGETLGKSFSKLKLSRVMHLLQGEKAEAAADGIALALDARKGKRMEALERALAGMPGSLEKEIGRIFSERHASRFGAADLDEALAGRLAPIDAQHVRALLGGDSALAAAALIRKEVLAGKNKTLVLYRILEKMSPQEITGMQDAYEHAYGESLRERLAETLPPGPQRDRSIALLDGDRVSAYAALLRCRLMGHKGDWVGGPFQNGDAATRTAVIEAYDSMYGRDFWKDLRRGIRKSDIELMEPLIRDGEVSSAVILYHCMLGIGTDEAGIVKILTGASKLEIEEIKRAYSERYKRGNGEGRDLMRDFELELSGDALFDVQELMRGAPETPGEAFSNMMSRYHHERSGSLIHRVDIITKEGRIMDQDVKAAADFFRSRIDGRSPDERELRRLDTLTRLAFQDFESFRTIKTWAANTVANLVAGTIGGAVTYTAVTAGAPLLAIVACAGAASMATRTLVKYNIKGSGYGREEVIRDTLVAAIDGGTLFMGRLVSSAIAQKVLKMAASAGLKQAVGLTQYIDRVRHSEHILAEKLKPASQEASRHKMEGIDLDGSKPADASFESVWTKARARVKEA